MAQSTVLTPIAKHSVTQYAISLRKRKISFEKIVVFGSHARGSASVTSDIDVCVISRAFGRDYHGALVSLMGAAIDVDGNLDIVPYTPGDLADRYDPLAKEIRMYGIRVV